MRTRVGPALIIATFIALASGSASASTVYDLNIHDGSTTSATGTITTDATLGTLAQTNIVDWDITATIGADTFEMKPSGSVVFLVGGGLSATASGLFFDFGDAHSSELIFGEPLLPGRTLCFEDASSLCNGHPSSVGIYLVTSSVVVPMSGTQQIAAVAQVAATPIPAALPLFASALGGLGFIGWRRRQFAAA